MLHTVAPEEKTVRQDNKHLAETMVDAFKRDIRFAKKQNLMEIKINTLLSLVTFNGLLLIRIEMIRF